MEVKFYNSLTRKIEIFKPIKENEVNIYVCGPTVYNDPHIGNMRPAVFFDTLRKFLMAIGYKVNYVSNYTDVDDKIINKAIEENVKEEVISTRYIEEYNKCLEELNILKATVNPKATEYIIDIINYINELINKGYAYIEDGEVFFDVSKIEDYGKLSNIDKENLISNARIGLNEKKHNQFDFLLWKKTDKGIKWVTPFCEGRPGWHTECCVMIDSIFKGKIDIHGGGIDLKFPHHENEIAQCEAMHNNSLANYWIHTAMMDISGEKMSKSLGNVILAKDAIKEYGANVVRLILLNAQYRQTINFTDKLVEDNQSIINKIYNCIKQLAFKIQINNGSLQGFSKKINQFYEFLADDMNIPNAITYTLELIKEANILLRNKEINLDDMEDYYFALCQICYIFGLKFDLKILSPDDIKLYKLYLKEKENKNFNKSDELRSLLITKGIF